MMGVGRGNSVAVLDEAICEGCVLCLPGCRYGGLIWVTGERTLLIDPWSCTGCGTCVSLCPRNALHMEERAY
jgi:MinD superfamily P-loop ATPase